MPVERSPIRDEVLERLRRLEEDAARRDDELWETLEEIRDLLEAAVRGRREEPRAAPAGRDAAARARYRRTRRTFRRFAREVVPEGARFAVVSRGDDELLDLPLRVGEHFPQAEGGVYAGYYPPDGTALVAQLEAARARGAASLLFPPSALWWLDSFPRFAEYFERRYLIAGGEEAGGLAVDLREPQAEAGTSWFERLLSLLDGYRDGPSSRPSLLDWHTGLDLGDRLPGHTVFSPPEGPVYLPYVDRTVDVVALAGEDPLRAAEARRVAHRAVVRFPAAEAGGTSADGRSPPVIESLGRPPRALPTASIVIPTYQGMACLPACLRALGETLPADFRGEVIVVDDASRDGTADLLERRAAGHTWLRVLRNQRNLGFIESCNRGAEAAEGEFVVFLNDDTLPLEGWLPALLRTFADWPEAGAVGGRLVYPDGRLQEAGGLVFRNGSGANFGRGDYDVDGPLYAYVRRVQYCSGSLLATRRELLAELGGFDRRYRPAYYEDTDYCFSVRRAGFEVYYQPDARVVHAEGTTSGTDPERGVKRHQALNREKFRIKWGRELLGLPEAPSRYSRLVWHQLAAGEGTW